MKKGLPRDKYYEAIFKAHYRELFYYAHRMVNDTECAADITNDVFCYFWEKYDRLNLETSPLPLLYALVRNNCIDYLRHKEVEQKNRSNIHLEEWYGRSIQEVIEHERKINRIMEGIELLPFQTRKVFDECFLKGRKYKEVAEDFHISVNTVKTHIMRTLQFLREKSNR